MYYSYVEIEYVATSFSPARMDLALKLLTSTVDPTHCIRHSQTNNTHPWQQSIGSVQSGNQKKLHNPISPAGQSSTKSGRTSNTNLQKPLRSSDSGGGQQFPSEPMGQTPPPNSTDPQPAPTIECCSTVSAYQYVNGPFNYNKMPLGPMGCAVQIHERC